VEAHGTSLPNLTLLRISRLREQNRQPVSGRDQVRSAPYPDRPPAYERRREAVAPGFDHGPFDDRAISRHRKWTALAALVSNLSVPPSVNSSCGRSSGFSTSKTWLLWVSVSPAIWLRPRGNRVLSGINAGPLPDRAIWCKQLKQFGPWLGPDLPSATRRAPAAH
jgi:hypothetical protein